MVVVANVAAWLGPAIITCHLSPLRNDATGMTLQDLGYYQKI
jgi:hypothetical protein